MTRGQKGTPEISRRKTGRELPRREFGKMVHEGLAICKRCRAIYQDKHWFFDEEMAKKLSRDKNIHLVICPGCQSIINRKVDGVVNLKSSLIKEHKDEILNLIHHEEEKEKQKNPISRIVEIESWMDEIIVKTTTQFLARRIGQAVDKAYNGNLEIQKAPREEFTRVNWTRE